MGFNPGDPPPTDPNGQPWQNPSHSFTPTDNNQYTGASRQIGEFGGYPVGQVDVRTDIMKQLEQGALPLLMQVLGNPQGIAKMFGGMAGPVPGMPNTGLSSFLFNDAGSFSGAPGGGMPLPGMPPGGGGGGLPLPPGGGGGLPPTGGQPPLPPVSPPGTTNTPRTRPNDGGAGAPQPGPNPYMYGQQSGPQPDWTGTTLGGGQVPITTNTSPTYGTDLNSILAQFGLKDDNSIGGFSGLQPGTGAPGKELNLAMINSGLMPHGYALGGLHSQYNQATNDFNPRMMELFGPQGFRQQFSSDAAGVEALKTLLGSKGVQFRAMGGPLDPNAPTIVGEAGPELITPAAAGGQQQVLPMSMMRPPKGTELPGAGGGVMPGIPQPGISGVMPNMTMMEPQTTPGAGIYGGGMTNMMASPNTGGGFPSSPVQGQGTGSIQRLLEQNPEMEAFNAGKNILFGQGGMLGSGGGGQGILNALQPVFQQNLGFGLNELANRIPSVRNSAGAIEGADLTSRAMNDFNLFAAQALQQGQQNTLGGLGMLGQLAGQAGGGQFGRHMQAGQLATQRDLGMGSLGLQAQQQAYNQAVNPTLQLLLAALGMATPTGYQTVVPGKK